MTLRSGRLGLSDLYSDAVQLLGRTRVFSDRTYSLLHSYDASMERGQPDLVVLPQRTEELCGLIAAAYRHQVPFVMRGAGTGYSGGALAANGGMVILTSRLNRILQTDFEEGWIRCEPGVVLADVQRIALEAGWSYPPDPSSHQVCTIGGNVAENAGGPHALGGGPTSNYVRALDLVRPDGRIVTLEEQDPWDGRLDLRSVVVGSEGTLGAVASVTLRLVRAPEESRVVLGTFAAQDAALAAIETVFDLGLLPSALDMLTGGFIPGRADFADDSLLFIGLQGRREEVAHQARELERCLRAHGGIYELLVVREFLERRAVLVRDKVRRMVDASGYPRYYLFDAVAPRSSLASLMKSIHQAAEEYQLPVLNTFHAGDGNVHPTPFYDPDAPDHRARLMEFSKQILKDCARNGGALSGEHGIGLEKRELMPEFFPTTVLSIMQGIKEAFDGENLCNPGKILPLRNAPDIETRPVGPLRRSVRSRAPRLHRVDALIEVGHPVISFGAVEAALGDSPYELPYEPLGVGRDHSVLEAIDLGLPGLREAAPARARDLILSADIQRHSRSPRVGLGGTVAKDVAGYELRKLVYGARGRLGLLRSARLRLVPRTTDSRLVQTHPLPLNDAVELCRRVHATDLPLSYLGVLLAADGSVTVTGRLELRGGTLERHLERLQAVQRGLPWQLTEAHRWNDPAMSALVADGPLSGCAGMPWSHPALLQLLLARRTAAFASVGHRRTWWRGMPTVEPQAAPALIPAVIAAFRAVVG